MLRKPGSECIPLSRFWTHVVLSRLFLGGTVSKLVELDKCLLKIVIVLESLLHVVVITYAEVVPNYYPCITLCRGLNLSGASQLHSQSSMDENHDVGIHDSGSVDLPNSDSGKRPRVWSSSPEHGSKTDRGKQIFCNRSLNMKNIVAVGFDMDYTLAQYKPETFESLAYQGTIKKLVYDLGYPSEVCPISLTALLPCFSFFLQ